MTLIEESISDSIRELKACAGDIAEPAPAHETSLELPTTVVLSWLGDLAQEAATATQSHEFSSHATAALAALVGTSHYAVGQCTYGVHHMELELRRTVAEDSRDSVSNLDIDLDNAESLVAHALQTGKQVQVEDLNHSDVHDVQLQGCGIRAVMATPLLSGTQPVGALLLGDDQPRVWTDEHTSLLAATGHIVTGAFKLSMLQADLNREQSLGRALRSTSDAALIIMSPNGTITEVNAAACHISGFEPEQLVGRSIWSALIVAEDMPFVKQAFSRLHKTALTERFESYVLTKRGERRRLSWSISSLDGDEVGEPAMVCTGIDITERCLAVERAVRAEASAASAQQLFSDLQQQIAEGEKQISSGDAAQRLPMGVDYDRRSRARRDYPYYQLIAPLRGGKAPDHGAFVEKKCHDISSRGFAFLTRKKPDYDKVVVAFGTRPAIVYLTADVRHVTAKDDAHPPQYVVGCRYSGRIRQA